MKYKNPPIVEAICEFRFSKETKWDPTIAGSVYEKVKDQFPSKESRLEQQVEVKAGDAGFSQNLVASQRAIMLSPDRSSLIQVGQHLLSVNHLKPYAGWENFRPKIKMAYDTLNSITAVEGIERMALVYIDRIEIPGKKIEMEEYFKFYPSLGSDLPHDHMGFMVGVDFPFNDQRDFCKLQLTSAMATKKDHIALLMTTEYYLAKRKSVSPEKSIDWMEEAHTKIRELFRGCITEKLEDIFVRLD
ncbi:MAG: TIGR04255 family protein [Methanoregula sp.]|jgi:uncharacterized protein (TIGR04255 family)|uniref:TIGR04255 family protein n=1 Tax=Methanoregula sp. TaxID=2052170 RepID=UPI003D0A76BD